MYKRGYKLQFRRTEKRNKMWHVTNRQKIMLKQVEINECQETRSSKRYYDNKKAYSNNNINKN
jgi:hypothetical protein